MTKSKYIAIRQPEFDINFHVLEISQIVLYWLKITYMDVFVEVFRDVLTCRS